MFDIWWPEDFEFIEVSQSSVAVFMHQCQRKFMYPKILGVPRDIDEFETGAALVGQALHKAYQVFVETRKINTAIQALMFAFPSHIIHQIDDKRNLFACMATLERLCSIPKAKEELLTINNRPATEVSFKVPLAEIKIGNKQVPIYYVGFIDKIVKDKDQIFRVIDLKTYSGYEYDILLRHQFDFQLTGYHIITYLFYLQSLKLPEEKFNVEYIITQIKISDPDVDGKIFTRNKEHVVQWFKMLKTFLDRLQQVLATDSFIHNSTQCKIYNRPCPHFDDCVFGDNNFLKKGLYENNKENINQTRVPEPDIFIEKELLSYGW